MISKAPSVKRYSITIIREEAINLIQAGVIDLNQHFMKPTPPKNS